MISEMIFFGLLKKERNQWVKQTKVFRSLKNIL
jgi:hypothetical protein